MVGMDIKVQVAKLPAKKALREINSRAIKRIVSLPLGVGKKKVLNIRRQLAEGEYGIDKRLNAAVDKLLEELLGCRGIKR